MISLHSNREQNIDGRLVKTEVLSPRINYIDTFNYTLDGVLVPQRVDVLSLPQWQLSSGSVSDRTAVLSSHTLRRWNLACLISPSTHFRELKS